LLGLDKFRKTGANLEESRAGDDVAGSHGRTMGMHDLRQGLIIALEARDTRRWKGEDSVSKIIGRQEEFPHGDEPLSLIRIDSIPDLFILRGQ